MTLARNGRLVGEHARQLVDRCDSHWDDCTGEQSSGDLQKAANFTWTTDTVGRFPFRCTYHHSQVIATLVVTA